MTKVSELPTNPQDAFERLLNELHEAFEKFPKSGTLQPLFKASVVSTARKMLKLSHRLENGDDYQELLENCIQAFKGNSPRVSSTIIATLEDAFLSNALDDHLVNEEDERQLNTLDWRSDDKAAVLQALGEARNIVNYGAIFDNDHKRRVLYWLAKAENEVFQEEGKWDRFRAAVSELSDTVKEVGEKAEPFAKLIQMARTSTKRNITEVRQIEAEEAPKQIAPPEA